MTGSLPPGPHDWLPGRLHLRFLRDPLGCLQGLARDYGDITLLQREPELKVLLNHPDLIKDVLVTHSKNFAKGRVEQREWRALMGEGLLDSDGDYHLRQRRLMEPAFHRERIARYAEVMVHHSLRLQEKWQDGQTLDMQRQMMHLALSISGKTLFDADVDSPLVGEVDRSFRAVMRYVKLKRFVLGRLLVKLPLPTVHRFHEAMERLDGIFHRVIEEHRQGGKDRGDLLSMLLAASDGDGPGNRMTDKQVRDEVATLFIAGYETTANSLTWTWYLLSQNPEAEAKLHTELEAVLAGRPPRPDDVPRLVYAEKVFREALRLYPPPWAISRRALAEHAIGGYVLPADTVFVMSPYVIQRDPRFYPEPDRFHPDRWTPEFKATLHPYAYIPFGGGPRKCIGEQFAWTEATLAIAAIAQKWRLQLAPGQRVVARPVLQIRPKYGMRMVLHRRA